MTDPRALIVSMLPRLRAFARALTRHREDADDLVQATCEKALGALDSFTAGSRLDSWMFRIMHNHFVDTRRALRQTRNLDDVPELSGEDGRRVTEARLEVAQVQRAIAALPEEQRAVLVLVCVEGLRYREAAEVLDLPIGTVMSRLARSRAAVAAVLDEDAGAPKPAVREAGNEA